MTTIEVPGTVPAPSVHQGAYLGVGAFSLVLVGALVWVAIYSGDLSLWVLPASSALLMAAFVALNLSTLVGRAGRIRLTRRRGCWAALGSRTGQLLLLTAFIVTLLISAGVIVVLPEAHPLVWLFGLFGVLGTAESALRLVEPLGWRFNQDIVGVTVPKKGSTAFTWNEVDIVQLRGRVVAVTGLGHTVEVNGGDTASDPAVVARVIEFYRTNPRSRAELSDDRFLERLRSGRL